MLNKIAEGALYTILLDRETGVRFAIIWPRVSWIDLKLFYTLYANVITLLF